MISISNRIISISFRWETDNKSGIKKTLEQEGRKRNKKTWQLPTLPRTGRSTIGVRAFHLRVRDGNVCFSPAMATRKVQVLMRVVACILNPLSGDENDNMVKPHGSLVPVG